MLALLVGIIWTAAPAQAAVGFSVTPLTWDVIGLDSNDVTKGPNDYEVGIRGCNTGTTNATTTIATLTWDSANAFINIQPGTSDIQVVRNLGAGVCFDYYFNIEITRNAAAWFTTRQFHITLQDCPSDIVTPGVNPDGTCSVAPTASVSTPATHRIYVEKIISQNRNYVSPSGPCPYCGIYGSLTDPDGPAGPTAPTTTPALTNVLVGSTYTYVLVASTAPGGYGSWSAQLNFVRGIFQIQTVSTVLQTFPATPNAFCCREDLNVYTTAIEGPGPNGTIHEMWANACGYNQDFTSPGDHDCATTNPPKNDKAGDLVYITYSIKILKAGSGSLTGVVWDGSGSSYHYNSDYGTQVIAVTATKPTDATFVSGKATTTPDGVEVAWSTGFEANNLGFNVYGEEGGQKVKLNDSLIAGSALSAGGDATTGRSYRWLAPDGGPDGPYWVEAVDLNGESDWNGPISVSGTSDAPAHANSPSLSELNAAANADTLGSAPRVASSRVARVAPAAPPASSGPAANIAVDHEGWYSVPLTDLHDLGIDTSAPKRLLLTAEGVPQPTLIRGGALQFYGIGLDTPQTATRVYRLSAGSEEGPAVSSSNTTGGPAAPSSYPDTVERRDRTVYFSSLLNGEESNFFGSPVTKNPSSQIVTLDSLASADGTVHLALQGVTSSPHDVSVSLNGTPAGDITFPGREQGTLAFAAANLQNGDNTLSLVSSGPSDVSLVDHIRITADRNPVARDDTLRFTTPGGDSSTATGFTQSTVRTVDVTNPAAPVELQTSVTPDGAGGYNATATAPGAGTRTLYAYTEAESPGSVAAVNPSSLHASSNAADMLIITNDALASSFQPLEAFHDGQGLDTSFINIDDVYNEFSYGEESPDALRKFIGYTQHRWSGTPRFVLLGGDGSLDPRGFQGPAGAAADIIPVKLLDTRFMETASDPWFTWPKKGRTPTVALGRMPVRTSAEADAFVAKTIDYATSSANNDYVIATDEADDGFNFQDAADSLATVAPDGTDVQQINRADANARTNLLAAINESPSVLNYIGHGSVDLWNGEFFTNADSPSLTNTDHPAFFVAMTCLNGYFMDPNLDSLAESMVKAPGGAVAAWASTGQTFPIPQVRMNRYLYKALGHTDVIGDAITQASSGIHDKDVLATWVLIGDPALRLR